MNVPGYPDEYKKFIAALTSLSPRAAQSHPHAIQNFHFTATASACHANSPPPETPPSNPTDSPTLDAATRNCHWVHPTPSRPNSVLPLTASARRSSLSGRLSQLNLKAALLGIEAPPPAGFDVTPWPELATSATPRVLSHRAPSPVQRFFLSLSEIWLNLSKFWFCYIEFEWIWGLNYFRFGFRFIFSLILGLNYFRFRFRFIFSLILGLNYFRFGFSLILCLNYFRFGFRFIFSLILGLYLV
jgi:hypothetical protein